MWAVCLETVFLCGANAADFYVDPIKGSNKNSGRSTLTAWRSPKKVNSQDTIIYIGPRHDQVTAPQRKDRLSAGFSQPGIDLFSFEQMDQIILGVTNLQNWAPYPNAINAYQAPFRFDSNQLAIDAVRIEDRALDEACAGDFLKNNAYFWHSNVLYLHSPRGNPGRISAPVTATLFNPDLGQYTETDVGNWSQAPVSVWQTYAARRPIRLYRDGQIYTDYWWGEDDCGSEPNKLYVRSRAGTPNSDQNSISAVMEEGGWQITSGDFNGDALADVITSDYGPNLFSYSGALNFSALAEKVITAPDGQDVHGFDVVAAGDVNQDGYEDLLVGMDWGDNRVYLYFGKMSGITADDYQLIRVPRNQTAFGFGHGLASAGDINADGYSDLLIGGGGSFVGIYLGNASGIDPQPNRILPISGSSEGEIINVAGLGDLNGDGFDDIAVSAFQINVDSLDVHLFYGSAQGLQQQPQILSFPISAEDISKGLTIGSAGDVNGDGFDDLLIADTHASYEFERDGIAYLYLGSAQGVRNTPDLNIENPEPQENDRFGETLSALGDFDADGFDDFAISSPNAGKVHFFFGSPNARRDDYLTLENSHDIGWSISPVGSLKGNDQNFIAVAEEFGVAYLYSLKEGQILPDNDTENQAPVAHAGEDQTAQEGSTVYLDGSGSSDPDDGIAGWHWTQTEGPSTELSDYYESNPYFVTPAVRPAEGVTLKFNLMVQDHHHLQSNSEVAVFITDNGITGFPENAVTLASSDGKQMGFKIEQGGTLVGLSVQPPDSFIDEENWENSFSYDLVSLAIKTIEIPGRVELTCYLSEPVSNAFKVLQYNADSGWRDISNSTVFDATRTQFRLVQNDGQPGDEDGTVDGLITTDRFGMSDGKDLPPDPSKIKPDASNGSGGGGCFVESLYSFF